MPGRFYFDPDATGTAIFMGRTEALLMDLAWDKKELTVKSAQFYLGPKQQLAYTTLLTTLSRLTQKGYLVKEKRDRSFTFIPARDRDSFIDSRLETIAQSLKRSFSGRLDSLM